MQLCHPAAFALTPLLVLCAFTGLLPLQNLPNSLAHVMQVMPNRAGRICSAQVSTAWQGMSCSNRKMSSALDMAMLTCRTG